MSQNLVGASFKFLLGIWNYKLSPELDDLGIHLRVVFFLQRFIYFQKGICPPIKEKGERQTVTTALFIHPWPHYHLNPTHAEAIRASCSVSRAEEGTQLSTSAPIRWDLVSPLYSRIGKGQISHVKKIQFNLTKHNCYLNCEL